MTAPEGSFGEWFLSYNSADRAIVQDLEHILSAHGVSTFFDRKHLTPGTSWVDELQSALRRAIGLLVFLGPSGLGSAQKMEVDVAISRRTARSDAGGHGAPLRILLVLLPGHDKNQIPPFLQVLTWVELSNPSDPAELLAAVGITSPGSVTTGSLVAPLRPRAPACPFRGLQVFREEDAVIYFGRQREVEKLKELVQAQPFVAVVGSSGSGKSSMVQAGLVPKLCAESMTGPTWRVIVFAPGKRPLYNAAASLTRLSLGDTTPERVVEAAEEKARLMLAAEAQFGSYVRETLEHLGVDRLLIVVDQFEELFVRVQSDATRKAFLDQLLTPVGEDYCRLVVTLRADYYGHAIGLSDQLSELMERAQLNLGPMSHTDLRLAIVGPSLRAGLTFELGLIERILADVHKQPGSLPLLEFTLTELWNAASTGQLSHADYERLGKVDGALGGRADAVIRNLSPSQRERAPTLLTRFVRLSSGEEMEGANTRRAVHLDELAADDRLILEEFAKARLVVFSNGDGGQALADVAHEALIRNWQSLQTWIREDLHFLVWRQRIGLFAEEWSRTGMDPSTLLGRALLPEAKRFLRSHESRLNRTESSFVEASVRRQSGNQARRRVSAAVALVLLAAVSAYWAWTKTDRYLVRSVLAEAPLRSALFSSYPWRTAYRQVPQEWVRTLIRTGHSDLAIAAMVNDTETSVKRGAIGACVKLTVGLELQALGTESSLPLDQGMLGRAFKAELTTDEFCCLAALPLGEPLRSMLLAVARRLPALDDRYDALDAARAANDVAECLISWGERDLAHDKVSTALRNSLDLQPEQRAQLLFEVARDVATCLLPDEQQQLLVEADQLLASKVRGARVFARKARLTLLASHVAPSDAASFVTSMPERRSFDEDVAAALAGTLSRAIREGRIDGTIQAARDITSHLNLPPTPSSYPATIPLLALLVPFAAELASAGQRAEALRIADYALVHANAIDYEDHRSRALAGVAKIFARCGRLAQAKEIADRCHRPLDRLAAYTAIIAAGPLP